MFDPLISRMQEIYSGDWWTAMSSYIDNQWNEIQRYSSIGNTHGS